jgi:hypothetical protein
MPVFPPSFSQPGSSDEISIPPPWPESESAQEGREATAEAILHEALRERRGAALPRWTDVLAVLRRIGRHRP